MGKNTHLLGAGTRNFPVNWPAQELEQLGRLASAQGMSLGALIKQFVRAGMEKAPTRQELKSQDINIIEVDQGVLGAISQGIWQVNEAIRLGAGQVRVDLHIYYGAELEFELTTEQPAGAVRVRRIEA